MTRGDQMILIALGGNLQSEVGAPAETLRAALTELAASGVRIEAVSRFFRTPCFPEGAGPDYVNAAARGTFDGTPDALLQVLHRVEAAFARSREVRWGQRTLDLDLIAFGQAVLPDAETHAAWRGLPLEVQMREAPGELILPHPRLQDRGFVLVPLAEVAPGWVHPISGQSVTDMRDALNPAGLAGIRPLDEDRNRDHIGESGL